MNARTAAISARSLGSFAIRSASARACSSQAEFAVSIRARRIASDCETPRSINLRSARWDSSSSLTEIAFSGTHTRLYHVCHTISARRKRGWSVAIPARRHLREAPRRPRATHRPPRVGSVEVRARSPAAPRRAQGSTDRRGDRSVPAVLGRRLSARPCRASRRPAATPLRQPSDVAQHLKCQRLAARRSPSGEPASDEPRAELQQRLRRCSRHRRVVGGRFAKAAWRAAGQPHEQPLTSAGTGRTPPALASRPPASLPPRARRRAEDRRESRLRDSTVQIRSTASSVSRSTSGPSAQTSIASVSAPSAVRSSSSAWSPIAIARIPRRGRKAEVIVEGKLTRKGRHPPMKSAAGAPCHRRFRPPNCDYCVPKAPLAGGLDQVPDLAHGDREPREVDRTAGADVGEHAQAAVDTVTVQGRSTRRPWSAARRRRSARSSPRRSAQPARRRRRRAARHAPSRPSASRAAARRSARAATTARAGRRARSTPARPRRRSGPVASAIRTRSGDGTSATRCATRDASSRGTPACPSSSARARAVLASASPSIPGRSSVNAARPGAKRSIAASTSSGRGRLRSSQRAVRSSRIRPRRNIAICVPAGTKPSSASISAHSERNAYSSRAAVNARATSSADAPVSSRIRNTNVVPHLFTSSFDTCATTISRRSECPRSCSPNRSRTFDGK